MTKTNILRKGVAIAICLAATTFGAQAQLGGMLKKAAGAVKKEVTPAAEKPAEQSTTGRIAQPAANKAPQQPWAVDKNRKGTIQATFADGVLTFTGAGEMVDFTITMHDDERPWAANAKEITSAVVEEGITHLSEFAFYGCENLTSVSLPTTLVNIRGAAFYGCKLLTTITLPQKLEVFSTGTVPDGKGSTNMVGLFGQCTALTEINPTCSPYPVSLSFLTAALSCGSILSTTDFFLTKGASFIFRAA